MRDIDLIKKMSDARVELDAALYKCYEAHKNDPMNPSAPSYKDCKCIGCSIKGSIERAMNSLET